MRCARRVSWSSRLTASVARSTTRGSSTPASSAATVAPVGRVRSRAARVDWWPNAASSGVSPFVNCDREDRPWRPRRPPRSRRLARPRRYRVRHRRLLRLVRQAPRRCAVGLPTCTSLWCRRSLPSEVEPRASAAAASARVCAGSCCCVGGGAEWVGEAVCLTATSSSALLQVLLPVLPLAFSTESAAREPPASPSQQLQQ